MSFWWGHALLALLVLINLHRVSQYYIFWILLLITALTASSARLSIEYFLTAAGCIAFALGPWWQNKTEKSRKNILLIFFSIFYILILKKLCFYERGSLLLWFPIFLSLYFQGKDKSTNLSYLISGILLSFNNKKTIMLAYVSTLTKYLKLPYLIAIATAMIACSFIFVEKISRFIEMSLVSRIYIWKSTLTGWLAKPIWGHGFGTFTIDFPPFRTHSEVFGARMNQQVIHGHGLFTHFLFEQGLIGFALVLILFYLVYKFARPALLPLLVIALLDSPLVIFHQYILAALILSPFIKDNIVAKKFSAKFTKACTILSYIIALVIFGSSVMGHFYYSTQRIDYALQWDPYHPLYHFTRGTLFLNRNKEESLKSLKRAAELAPGISYFYGFLAAAQLANGQAKESNKSADKALEMDGGEAYWHALKSFANFGNPDRSIFKEHFREAITKNPQIPMILKESRYTANAYLGKRGSDIRVPSFYRRGGKIFLPLPFFPVGLPTEAKEIIEANSPKAKS